MANETTTTSATDFLFASWVDSRILDEARPLSVSDPQFRVATRKPTLAYKFPVMADPGAAASNQAEGTAFANGLLSSTVATATSRLNGKVATITDVLDATAITDAVGYFSQVLGRSVAEELEVTESALYVGFTTKTGAGVTLANFLKAISQLELAEAVGDVVAVLPAADVDTLRQNVMVTLTAAALGSEAFSGAVSDLATGKRLAGYVGNISGVDVFQTTALATTNGGMFIKGETLGKYEVWGARSESHRDAFQPGTQITGTSHYGVAKIRDAWGVNVFHA
jgi:hypothetical protein